jgi:hypothetical protein
MLVHTTLRKKLLFLSSEEGKEIPKKELILVTGQRYG